ncbi:GTP cyclohydrolase FolE2 [Methanimicrococcus hongohii]|uniref:GTP cyclohydrolase MptA n=1 Tax=Methanimicrococcus hongohii TaxID=3028295 RepID=A0AA96VBS8_9EURY|nr:GTP cyclohydrolase MptA [Methanimicrococcus sp. Hf6]WNY24002.1 GTP cyclohydrolase FolE2 [Methanimicrococcus sp. Hf6]
MSQCPILPDVQANRPAVPINLTRVGVTDVKKLIEIKRENKRPIILMSSFDIFVDLPSDRKGANLSRNFEAIEEILTNISQSPVYEIENLCGDIAENLIGRHEYASRAEVRMKSEYMIRRKSPATGVDCQQFVDIFADAVAERTEGTNAVQIKKLIGAEVMGMTACPCAQSMMQEEAENKLKELGLADEKIAEFFKDIPMATHNQRGRGIISIQTLDTTGVRLENIIEIIEASMSSNVYEILKRADEKRVVEEAHQNPKFVEDCVRTMAKKVVDTFPQLPDDAIITIKQINEESIHKHNAFAERVAKIGDIRSEINNG